MPLAVKVPNKFRNFLGHYTCINSNTCNNSAFAPLGFSDSLKKTPPVEIFEIGLLANPFLAGGFSAFCRHCEGTMSYG